MDTGLSAATFAVSLVLGMLLLLEVGRRLGLKRLAREGSSAGFGAVESAVFALFGLLLAFTFSGAVERFYGRLGLIADEANAIGTAYFASTCSPPTTSRRCASCSVTIWIRG